MQEYEQVAGVAHVHKEGNTFEKEKKKTQNTTKKLNFGLPKSKSKQLWDLPNLRNIF